MCNVCAERKFHHCTKREKTETYLCNETQVDWYTAVCFSTADHGEMVYTGGEVLAVAAFSLNNGYMSLLFHHWVRD